MTKAELQRKQHAEDYAHLHEVNRQLRDLHHYSTHLAVRGRDEVEELIAHGWKLWRLKKTGRYVLHSYFLGEQLEVRGLRAQDWCPDGTRWESMGAIGMRRKEP